MLMHLKIGLSVLAMLAALALTLTYTQRPVSGQHAGAVWEGQAGEQVATGKGLLPPGQVAAGALAVRARQIANWRGTQIAPQEEADGEVLDFQRKIADQFRRLDPLPAERLRHFAWCDDPGIRLNGWYGRIREATHTHGGWRVEIRVSPYLSSELANVSFTPDYCIEVYQYGIGGLRFISSVKPPDASPGIAFGD